MTTQTMTKSTTKLFTTEERRALRTLRNRYRKEQDRFSDRERAQLGFVRFLSETGRLAS
jgi:hypothetical protein